MGRLRRHDWRGAQNALFRSSMRRNRIHVWSVDWCFLLVANHGAALPLVSRTLSRCGGNGAITWYIDNKHPTSTAERSVQVLILSWWLTQKVGIHSVIWPSIWPLPCIMGLQWSPQWQYCGDWETFPRNYDCISEYWQNFRAFLTERCRCASQYDFSLKANSSDSASLKAAL